MSHTIGLKIYIYAHEHYTYKEIARAPDMGALQNFSFYKKITAQSFGLIIPKPTSNKQINLLLKKYNRLNKASHAASSEFLLIFVYRPKKFTFMS